jgi:dihydroorotase
MPVRAERRSITLDMIVLRAGPTRHLENLCVLCVKMIQVHKLGTLQVDKTVCGSNEKPMTDTLTLRRPDDWHVHLRDGGVMRGVVPYTARQFARAIVMPNLSPPVTSVEACAAYRDRILAAAPDDVDFTPLMTAYLTDGVDGDELARGFAEGVFAAAKLYPAHATTGSAHGVTNIGSIMPALERMAAIGMPLLIHGEVTDSDVDIFDREAVFIERILSGLVGDLPELKIVFEHITTADAVAFVDASGPNVAATITPQHLHINRNAMFQGGIRPHAYCLPVAKREAHRLALRKAATAGNPKYFLGTDSAPHAASAKESACGCAGIFNAPYALESYVAVFDEEAALDKFEAFASENGPRFYGLPLNEGLVTLKRGAAAVPETVDANGTPIVPFHAGEDIGWKFVG